jgi:hypothetical protein
MKVMNMKVAGEDNHAEMMASYKPVAEDTSTSVTRWGGARAAWRAACRGSGLGYATHDLV